ncbi:MAG: hypothetical protein KGV44_13905 [Flavobacteriaceae bacterium]|nr:hypothetical protein [Flavobacteriaceae bacterium]
MENLGNKLHTRTKEKHLRRLLSFKEGDCLDIKQLEDNEEMLKNLSYVDELYIFITENTKHELTLEFLVKEKFAWAVSYQAHDINAHKVKLYSKNLWGLGHYIQAKYYYNPKREIPHSIGWEYTVPSIGNTHIRSTAIYQRNNHHTRYSIEISRPFLDYKTKYAGGIHLNLMKNADQVPTNNIASFDNSVSYREIDTWGGLALPYNLKKDDKYARYRKALTARIYHIKFSKHPDIKEDKNLFLLNTRGFLIGYNTSKKRLCVSNLIYNYGKLENIPYGHLTQLFFGGVRNEWEQKGYFGFNFEKSHYDTDNDYYFYSRLYGATFFNENKILDGLLSTEFRYISKLYRFRNTGHRHFVKLNYTVGFNASDDFLNLNESSGLRNFESQFARGIKKFSLNLEDVFFSPYTIAGFRSTFFTFGDMGYISRSNSLLNRKGHLYASIGAGLRLHNNNFVFKTFQISFSLFLKAPQDVNFFTPDASGVKTEGFDNLLLDKPRFYFERENLR